MDYLVDRLPLDLSPETRKYISQKAFAVIMWADWLCGARDAREMLNSHTSLLACEALLILCSLLTFVHACRHGARYVYLWLSASVYGLMAELYFGSGPSLFWHAQGLLTLFGRRSPLYVILGFYPTLLYTSVVASAKLFLPWWASSSASALLSLSLAAPFGVLGTKLLWITWHDTHPHVKDRLFDTPYTFYYFLAASASSFDLCIKFGRRFLLPPEYDWKKFFTEILCAFLTGMAAFYLALLYFTPLYTLFHEIYNVSSLNCLSLLVALLICLFWAADRKAPKLARPRSDYNRFWFDELGVVVIFYFLFFMGLIFVVDPYGTTSVGLHEPLGSCDSYSTVDTMLGTLAIKPRKYLCPTQYNEPYFDFHCLPGGKTPKLRDGQPLEWYTVCGTVFQNLSDYIFAIWASSLIALFVFYQFLAKSGEAPEIRAKKYDKRKKD